MNSDERLRNGGTMLVYVAFLLHFAGTAGIVL